MMPVRTRHPSRMAGVDQFRRLLMVSRRDARSARYGSAARALKSETAMKRAARTTVPRKR